MKKLNNLKLRATALGLAAISTFSLAGCNERAASEDYDTISQSIGTGEFNTLTQTLEVPNNNFQLISNNYTINIIFDTGTNFIFLPFEYIKEIEPDLNKLGCRIVEFKEATKEGNNFEALGLAKEYRLICSSYDLPKIQFKLGNTTFIIPNHLAFYNDRGLAYSYTVIPGELNVRRAYRPYRYFFLSLHQ